MSAAVLSLVEGELLNTRSLIGATMLVATVAQPAHAQAPEHVTVTPERIEAGYKESADLAYLRYQMAKHPQLPSVDFWLAVAHCETREEWDRGKDWGPNARSWVSGGLGLANTTWQGYGGLAFASKAAKASKYAQIIVANRVGFLGFQTSRYLTWNDRVAGKKFYRPAAGFGQGWGGSCRKAWLAKEGK